VVKRCQFNRVVGKGLVNVIYETQDLIMECERHE
jgi:hypothetical protein